MIIASTDQGLRLITQNDHAHLASQLLSLWRDDGLPQHPRRREILLAAREHDNGWREEDSAPRRDPASGRPHDFRTLPGPERRALWRRGVSRWAESELYPSLLIVQHALWLHREHSKDAEWMETYDSWLKLRQDLLDRCGSDPESVTADYAWIELSDMLSLLACEGWAQAVERGGFRARLEQADVVELLLEPFPLAGATTFKVPCRYLQSASFTSDTELGVALATSRWQELSIRVRPA